MKKLLTLALAVVTVSLQAQSLTASLSACYALNGNAAEPINNLTGTLSAVSATVDRFSNSNSALAFSGSSLSYVELPNNALLKPTNALSISGWVRTTSLSEQIFVFTRNNGTSNFGAYTLMMNQSGSNYVFRGWKEAGSGSSNFVSSTTTVAANTWYHLAYTVDNTSLKIYVNGVLEATAASTLNFSYNSGKKVYLGGTNESSFNLPLTGSLDNMRFYTRILSSTEIAQLYASDPVCTTPGQALNFDGASDFIDPNIIVTTVNNSFTYEFWARPTATHEIDPEGTSGSDGLYNQKYLLWPTWRGSTSVIEGGLGISVGTNGVSVYAHGHNYMPALLVWQGTISAWTHIAVVVTNKQPALYINGVLVKTGQTATTTIWPSLGAASGITTLGPQVGGIGGGSSSNLPSYYQGEMDEFRLWSSVRTPLQIQTFMSKELFCPAGLIAYYKFNHGIASAINSTVTSATDYSGNNYTASLNTFALSGSNSNWIEPGATLTGTATTLSAAATSTSICNGQTVLLTGSGSSSYTWSTGSNSSTISVTPSVTTTYILFGACSATAAVTISVNAAPIVSIAGSSSSVCPGTAVTLTASGALSYIWQPGNLTGAFITVTPQVTTAYTVTGSNGTCTSAAVFTKPVYPPALVFAISTPTSICAGATASLYAGGGMSYTWMPGGGTGPSYFVSPAASTVYTVTASDGTCTGNTTVGVVVNSVPVLTVNPSSTLTCSGNPLVISASGAGFYTWNPGNLSGSSVTVSPVANTVYTVTGSNGVCSVTAASTVNVLPSVSFTATASSPSMCTGNTVTLSATGASGYTWQPGNLSASTITVSPPFSTTYTITGTNGTCTATRTLALTVFFTPIVSAYATNSVACPGYSTTLWGSGASSYLWMPGNFTSSVVNTPPINSTTIFTLTGTSSGCSKTYTLSYTVNNCTIAPINCNLFYSETAVSGTGTIVASSFASPPSSTILPSVLLPPGAYGLAIAQPFGFTAPNPTFWTTANGNYWYHDGTTFVNTGHQSNGGNIGASPNFLYSHGSSGQVYKYNGTGNSTSLVSINALFGFTFNDIVCDDLDNFYIATISDIRAFNSAGTALCTFSHSGVSMSLNNIYGGFAISGNTVVLNNGANGGAYVGPFSGSSVNLSYVSYNGGTYDFASCYLPTAFNTSISASPSGVISCTTPVVTLSATPVQALSPSFTYTWTGPGIITGVNAASVNITSPGIYNCSVKSCVGGTSTVSYTVLGNPANLPVVITSVSPTICSGSGAALTASNAITYTWQPGGGSGQSISASPAATTIYTVSGTNLVGCVSSATILVTVNATPTISISGNSSVCANSMATLTASGASAYTWNPTGANQATILVSPAATVVFTVTGSSNNCTATQTRTLIYVPLPIVNISTTSPSLCSGNSATLVAGGASAFTWQPSGSLSSSIAVSPAVTATYAVIGSSAGCSATASVMIVVAPSPSLNITMNPAVLCPGTTFTLSGSGANSYSWLPGSSTSQSIVLTAGLPSTTVYTLAGAISGCTASVNSTVVVNPLPAITISASTLTTCSGSPVILAANGATGYTWQPVNQQGNTVTVTPAANTIYTVTGSNGFCVNTQTVSIIVMPAPLISISGNNTICPGASATLTGNGASTYTWMPGGSNTQTLVVSPVVTTIYTLSGTTNGCTSFAQFTVNMGPVIFSTITAVPSAVCPGGSSTLTVVSFAGTYTWFPGATVSQSIVVSPSATTIYTALPGSNSCSLSHTIEVTVLPMPVIIISASNQQVCQGIPVVLSASGALTYTWFPGNLNGASVTINPSVSTSYSVAATGTNGCGGAATTSISVLPTPTLGISGSTLLCRGEASALIASGAAGYTWQPGNITGASNPVSPSVSSTYTVAGVSGAGCISEKTILIEVVQPPTFTVSPDTVICAGGSVTVTANTGGGSINWRPLNSSANPVVISPSVTTTYTLHSTNGECASNLPFRIVVVDCALNSLGLANAAGNPAPVNSNFYKVSFTVTAENSSSLQLDSLVLSSDLASTFPYPITFTVMETPVLKAGSTLVLNNQFDGDAAKNITQPSSIAPKSLETIVYSVLVDPKGQSGTFRNSVTGSAMVSGKILVSDSSENGFNPDPDNDKNPGNNNMATPLLLPEIGFFVPNGFSPNGDGLFDFFVIKGAGEGNIHLTVMNRWGNKVFEKENYDNSWDGTSNTRALMFGNGKVPQGTYYYILKISNREPVTGFIEIQY